MIIEKRGRQKVTHIIAIANQKGGVGKTTTAINLGAYLSKQRKKVLIVDLDPQANTTSGLGINKNTLSGSVQDVLFNPPSVAGTLLETEFDGLMLLPARPELATTEVTLVNEADREFRLKKALEQLDFDVILIDCPPALGLLTINALTAAKHLLIPVQAEYYALEGLGQLLETVQRIREALNPDLELLGLVLTMFNSRTSLASGVQDEVKRHFGDKVFKTVIPRNVRLAEAPSYGKPISEHDRWSKGAKSYKQLAKELTDRLK